ncbi:hypothetical protein ACFQ08_10145, partial [Streptosporangium algeriense]
VRLPATSRVVLANRVNPPDALLREVWERTGDRPFAHVGDVIGPEEIRRISEGYRDVAGFSLDALTHNHQEEDRGHQ